MTGTTTTARWTGRATAARCCAIEARDRAYWKAANLTVFDGLRWMASDARAGRGASRASSSASIPSGARRCGSPCAR